jgi:predicted PurR-regulated permease PerM
MGIDDAQPAGNDFYHLVRRETDPALAKLREFLALSPEDQLRRAPGAPLGTLAHVLPALATSFLLFVFVLMDTGTIKRGVLAAVPNRLFEPALATIGDLEAALGRYAKALFTQCVLLGSLVALALALAGIPPSWAIVIGFFAGMANVMPYAGMATAFAGSAAYVLLAADGVSAWAVLAAILVTDAIKNIVLDPMVLGGALRLHPVVIVLGVAVGAKLFGLVGALLAVPAISLGLAFAGSVTRQLRAYATA